MRESRKFCQWGSNFDGFFCFFFYFIFLVDEGREDLDTTINGPSSAGQRNAIYRWHADDGQTLNAGLAAL